MGFISAMSVHLKIHNSCSVPVRAGASITLYRDEILKQKYEARRASGLTSPRAVPAWLQALRAGKSSPQVSKRGMTLPKLQVKCNKVLDTSIIGMYTLGHAIHAKLLCLMQVQPQHSPRSIVSPHKSRFLQDFEEAAASLPVSPSSSLPISPAQSLVPPQVHLTSSSFRDGEYADQNLTRRA